MKLNIVFLIPAAIAGYFVGLLPERQLVPSQPQLSTSVSSAVNAADSPPAGQVESKEIEIAIVKQRPVEEKPDSLSTIKTAFVETSRVPRLLMLLDVILKCGEKDLKSNLELTLTAFKNGLLEKSDLALICETAGSRCDSDQLTSLLSISGIDLELQKSMFKGCAESDPKGAVDALVAGRFNTKADFPSRQAFEGVLLGMDGTAIELEDIRAKFPQLSKSIDILSTTANARRHGISETLETTMKLAAGALKPANPEVTYRLGALADVAGSIDDETFLMYINDTIKSGTDLKLDSLVIATKFAQREYTKAFEYGLSIPPGDMRTNFLSTTIFETGMKDPDAAIRFVAEMPAGSRNEQEMLIRNFEASFRQSPAVSKTELPELMEQTQALIKSLKEK